MNDALRVWNMIQPHDDILSLVGEVRRRGIRTCLATNQQTHRFQYMKDELGYEALFDDLFVSCELGVAKPSVAYFQQVSSTIGGSTKQILFIDDNEQNVEAAKSLGLQAQVFHLREQRQGMETLLSRYDIS
jgi:putative hydrolase of the HAD superfamily